MKSTQSEGKPAVILNCLLLLLSLAVAAPSFAQSSAPTVILITIDGFPARALEDPQLPMPHLRALAAAGVAAKSMRPINPTVTWPNHTAMVTGVNASQHQVIANGLITQSSDGLAPRLDRVATKDKLVHARTLYEAAAEKGLTTAQVDWVAIMGSKSINWAFPEKPDLGDKLTSQIPEELIAKGLITTDQVNKFGQRAAAWHDQIWTDAAVDILEQHHPNLLLFHLLQTDGIQHEYGPLTPAAYASYAYADACLGRILESVHKAGMEDRTTYIIASDHGFAAYTHVLSLNAGLIEQSILHKGGETLHGDAWVMSEGGAAELFIHDPQRRAELIPKLKAYFATIPGIAHVYTNAEAHELGIPAEADSDQAPQLYLVAAADYDFEDSTTGPVTRTTPTRGSHGYLNTDPNMQALFIASGAAIKKGETISEIDNLRIAPTIAKILGLSMPDAKEPPLTEILR